MAFLHDLFSGRAHALRHSKPLQSDIVRRVGDDDPFNVAIVERLDHYDEPTCVSVRILPTLGALALMRAV